MPAETTRSGRPPISEAARSGAGGPAPAARVTLDADTRRWISQLRAGHPKYNETVAALHDLLRRVSISELSRRRPMLFSISGPEFDDLAQQAADDAVIDVLTKLDQFNGRCRFTTWVYKFAVYEVADKVARHVWRRQRPAVEGVDWDELIHSELATPEDQAERRAQLRALSTAIGELAERQRIVFVAVALNEVPVDVLAIELHTNRNAIYKNLFDARKRLRARMAAAGHPIGEERLDRSVGAHAQRCAAA